MKSTHNLRKGDRVTVEIQSIATGGEGVAKFNGIPIFINRVAPGDQVQVELFDVRKNFAFGKTLDVLRPSEQRCEPACKLFKICGGCHWQHIDYDAQVHIKTDLVRQAIKHIGGLDPAIVLPTVAAEAPLFYRNKVQYPVASPRNSTRLLAGYYKEGSHELVNIKHCPIQPEPLDRLLESAKRALENNDITAYNEDTHQGLLRHIAARYSFGFKEILVTFVINEAYPGTPATLKRLKDSANEIMAEVAEVAGCCVNFNTQRSNKIMGNDWLCLAGKDHLQERLKSEKANAASLHKHGLIFKLTPLSFFQVNTRQSERLLELVAEAIEHNCGKDDSTGTIIDAYGGVGTIALWLSPYAKRVVCIEEVRAAVEDGIAVAQLNAVQNVEFEEGKVEDILPKYAAEPSDGYAPGIKAIVVDPPRKGLAQSVIDTITRSTASLVIYVSCNPTTLARDLKLFAERKFRALSIQPVDMFPQTHHVESICVVKRDID